jgi:hypothetical protein
MESCTYLNNYETWVKNITMEPPIMNRFIWKSHQSNYFLQKDKVFNILFQSYSFISISYVFF